MHLIISRQSNLEELFSYETKYVQKARIIRKKDSIKQELGTPTKYNNPNYVDM